MMLTDPNSVLMDRRRSHDMPWGDNCSTGVNKLVTPYNVFKSRSCKKWPTVVASLILVACLAVEIIQHGSIAFADTLAIYDLALRSR